MTALNLQVIVDARHAVHLARQFFRPALLFDARHHTAQVHHPALGVYIDTIYFGPTP
jgi:hypothetical protein